MKIELVEMKWRHFVLCFIVGVARSTEGANSMFEDALAEDFKSFLQTGNFGRVLKNAAREFDLAPQKEERWTEPMIRFFCTFCETAANELLRIDDPVIITQRSIQFCVQFGFGTQYVCEGLINSNVPEVFYIIENTPGITGQDICGVAFVFKGCKTKNPDRVWEVPLPDVAKPPIDETPYPQSDVSTLKVLHLSDTHWDPEYVPGSPTVCEEMYLCCRDKGIPPANPNEAAGFWGNYGVCDIPKWTLAAIYDHISKTHNGIDFIIWTGDLIPHSVWEISKEGNKAIIQEMADLISEYFPGVPVYPSVGNHEGDPVNQFAQPYVDEAEFDVSWLYDEFASIWGRWLPQEAATSIAYGGYYSVQIRPGLKVISINTNYCYGMNWFLIHDSTDIAEQLEFMGKELQKSEDIGEMVYILGHMPVGSSDCSLTWSNQFNKVVSRYENTIAAIFYGDTHKDHFQLHFDPENKDRACAIGYVGQSQTTYNDLNPGYKIYTVEGDFEDSRYRVLDHDNHILDLAASNAVNETKFAKLYSAHEEYGLGDLSPASWYQLVLEMNKPNSSLFDAFYRNQIKASPPYLARGCSDDCKAGVLCFLLVSDNSDRSKCDVLSRG